MGDWVKKDGHWQYASPAMGETLTDFKPRPKAESGDYWGNWVYDAGRTILTHKTQNYELPLGEITTAQKFAEWVAQMSEKVWVTPVEMGQLIAAIRGTIGIRPLAHPNDRA